MRILTALLVTLFLATPASAGLCWYENPDGDRLTFLGNGENEVVLQQANGQTETCLYGHADNGDSKIWCNVESRTESVMTKAVGSDVLSAFDAKWASHCLEVAH